MSLASEASHASLPLALWNERLGPYGRIAPPTRRRWTFGQSEAPESRVDRATGAPTTAHMSNDGPAAARELPKIAIASFGQIREALRMSRPASRRSRGDEESDRAGSQQRFFVFCKTPLDSGVIDMLIEQRAYWGPSSPGDRLGATVQRHFLVVWAESGEHALFRARSAVLAAGGGAPDLSLVGTLSPSLPVAP